MNRCRAQRRWCDDPETLYDRYAAHVYRYACRRLGVQAAEDVVADTFLAAFGRWRRYDLSRPDARPWLFGIATKEIARRRRAEQTHLRAVERIPVDPPWTGPARCPDRAYRVAAVRW